MALNSPLPDAKSKRISIRQLAFSLLLLVMFAFVVYLALTDKTDRPQWLIPGSALNNPPSEALPDTSIKRPELMLAPVNYIAGISTSLDLRGDITAQILNGWKLFEYYPLAKDLDASHPRHIYVVYHNYKPLKQTLDVTYGYPVSRPTEQAGYINTVSLTGNRYVKREGATVLDFWKSPGDLTGQLAFNNDFEMVQLDRSYKVKQQTAYLSIKKR